jgi:hypothetical protein
MSSRHVIVILGLAIGAALGLSRRPTAAPVWLAAPTSL